MGRTQGREMKVQGIPLPLRIVLTYRDPFDEALLLKCDLLYQRRKSADGFYSRYAKHLKSGLKQIQSEILQGREPKINVEIIRL